MKKIFIFGTGPISQALTYHISSDIDLIGYIVSDNHYNEEDFLNKPVIKLSDLNNYEFDNVILATIHSNEIKDALIIQGVKNEKIIDYYLELLPIFDTRIAILRRIADEINERDIKGSTAELGVYRGEFARYINQAFPTRKLYLFDTFSGFDKQDVEYEREEDLSKSNQGDLCNVDINIVLDKMINKENCIIKKGYFPDTAEGLEEEFVFVSIDVDLYIPIYEGIKYFYPRLKKGGAIFIHDYNNWHYPGVKKAVKEYCDNNNISYLPISDYGGSIVIIK